MHDINIETPIPSEMAEDVRKFMEEQGMEAPVQQAIQGTQGTQGTQDGPKPAKPDPLDQIQPDPVVAAPDAMASLRIDDAELEARVEVTDGDRESYLEMLTLGKAIELEFRILDGKIPVRIRSRTTEEADAALDQVKSAQHADRDLDMVSGLHRLQQYAALQEVLVFGEPTGWFGELPAVDDPEYGTRLEALRKARLSGMPAPRWRAIYLALQIFEIKLAKLHRECLSGNF